MIEALKQKHLPQYLITASLALVLLLSITTASHATTVVGTFNIRYDNPKDATIGNGWQQRAPVIASLIRFHQFDVLGIQEAYQHQVTKLQTLLPAYKHIGCGRDDGKAAGEYAAIFYRRDVYALKDSGTFWLSPTPEVPSVGWDAKFTRICTWVKLECLADQKTLYVFNTHFDHQGVTARVESSRLILQKIRDIAVDQPVVLMGDFNIDQTGEGYELIHKSGLLNDAFDTAEETYSLNGTANGFKPGTYTDRRIDHVFHTAHFKPVRYGVLTDTYRSPAGDETENASTAFPREIKFKNYEARTPSDHFPVLVEFQ